MLHIHPHFGAAGLALAVPLVAYVLFGEPILGRRAYARLKQERERDSGALVRFYRLTMEVQWAWTALVVLILLVSSNVSAASIGLALPVGRYLPQTLGFTAYVVVLLGVSTLALRRRAASGKAVPGQGAIAELLPRTPVERRLAIAVALTAGVCEELLYRGMLVALAVALFGLPIVPAAVVAVAVFAVAHVYQGVAGALGTALLGALLSGLYVYSGSLLLPIAVHALIDLRSLVLVPPAKGHSSRPSHAGSTPLFPR